MTHDPQIETYLKQIRAHLALPRADRARAIEEIRQHLEDGTTAIEHEGEARPAAIATVIRDFGPPEAVAAEFNAATARPATSEGLWRWAPLLPAMVLLSMPTALLAWSVTWTLDGWTRGERRVQFDYIQLAVEFGAIAFAALLCLRQARRDRRWRWAAWACAGFAVVLAVFGQT